MPTSAQIVECKMETETDGDERQGEQRKRRKLSKVWDHYKLNRAKNTVQCVHCKTELALSCITIKLSSSNLMKLKKKLYPIIRLIVRIIDRILDY